MKLTRWIALFVFLAVGEGLAQTRAIVPRGDGEGSVGDATRAWGTGVFARAIIRGVDGNLFTDAPGDNVTRVWLADGNTNYYWGFVNGPDPVSSIGTNREAFTSTVTNGPSGIFTVPAGATNLAIWVWGAGGGWRTSASAGGPGEFRFVVITTVPSTQYRVIVGNTGGMGAGNGVVILGGYPGGGNAHNYAGNGAAGGGGYSGVFVDDALTNYIVVAGGGGGSVFESVYRSGGAAGSLLARDGGISGTNSHTARGALCTDYYGGGAIAGTNDISGTWGDGSLWTGGNGTNIQTSGGNWSASGGGGGYYGGAGGVLSNTTAGIASGSGGIGVTTTNCLYTYAERGANGDTPYCVVPATDRPEWISNRGFSGQPGLVVFGW